MEQLSISLGHYAKGLRHGIAQAEKAGDAVTQDILTRVCGATDKLLWFVESNRTMTGTDTKKAAATAGV